MKEQYDDFDRALLRAGRKAAPPTSRMRSRALSAAAAVGATGAATAATTTKAAAATKVGALAKATKAILLAKWTMVAAVTTASVGTAVYVVETRVERNDPVPVAAVVAPPVMKPAAPIPSSVPVVASEEAPPAEEAPAPKPVIVAKPAHAPVAAAKTVDPLREELGLVEDARRALAAGDAPTALRHVDDHARRFPSGAFTVERDVIRIDALTAAGRRDEAASRARDFVAHHPGSAQARRIAKMTETNP